MEIHATWPEIIPRVQSLAEAAAVGITNQLIPERYIKPPHLRPTPSDNIDNMTAPADDHGVEIPVIDLSGLDDDSRSMQTVKEISEAGRKWGFFQAVNHGVSQELMDKTREVWREFFYLPLEEKEVYANTPQTYEGYGSRLGVEKGALLDWGDYFFLHCYPQNQRDTNKWPALPKDLRDTVKVYGEKLMDMYVKLLEAFSLGLGLKENFLKEALGGVNDHELATCMRACYYPKCPQPDLTLGLSPHSDNGVLTILLPDDEVKGLQVRVNGKWVTVNHQPGAFIINVADQLQIVSNAIYKSVEHRAIVNSQKERLSIACFCNPKSDIPLGPAPELVLEDRPARYRSMTFNEYRLFIRKGGPKGKTHVESLTSSTT